MTRDQFIDYWTGWLHHASRASIDADYIDGVITMRTSTERFTGEVLPCNCDREDCLGWVVLTVKEKLPGEAQ